MKRRTHFEYDDKLVTSLFWNMVYVYEPTPLSIHIGGGLDARFTCCDDARYEAARVGEAIEASGPRIVGGGTVDGVIRADVVPHLTGARLRHRGTTTVISGCVRTHLWTIGIAEKNHLQALILLKK